MKILTYPNSILTRKAQEVDNKKTTSKDFRLFVKKLIVCMHSARGVGIAAPQVGKSWRVCIINKDAHEKLKDDLVLINPRIIARSKETSVQEEGCLSLPNCAVLVPRATWITIHAQIFLTRRIEEKEWTAKGYFARVIQHEIDHLDGILIIDRGETITATASYARKG